MAESNFSAILSLSLSLFCPRPKKGLSARPLGFGQTIGLEMPERTCMSERISWHECADIHDLRGRSRTQRAPEDASRIKLGPSQFWSHMTLSDVFGLSRWRWHREFPNIDVTIGKAKGRETTQESQNSPPLPPKKKS